MWRIHLGWSTKRIKLPWFLFHREADEFPQKEQELCWLLALPILKATRPWLLSHFSNKSSPKVSLCVVKTCSGKIDLDRQIKIVSSRMWIFLHKEKSHFLPVNWEICYPLQCREVSSMTLAGFQAIYYSVDFICLWSDLLFSHCLEVRVTAV